MPNPITPIEVKGASPVNLIQNEELALRLNLVTRKLNEIIQRLNEITGRVEDLEELP